jgi:solute:Na+ symporter, SSS family
LIAGLLAAFMSTYAATVNAAPAYFVNDIYKRYINPDGDNKLYVKMSYWVSFILVAIGIGFGFFVESINDVMQWIFGALFGGYTAANLLKWHWWRFNGFGFFWGMMAGLIASLLLPFVFPDLQPLYGFPYILAFSLVGCLFGTFLTKPDEEEVLKHFYKTVRPWGFWGPIKEKVIVENPDFKVNKAFSRDMFNVVIGTIWQLSLVVMPIYLVIREMVPLAIGFGVFAVTSFVLKKNWLDKLED